MAGLKAFSKREMKQPYGVSTCKRSARWTSRFYLHLFSSGLWTQIRCGDWRRYDAERFATRMRTKLNRDGNTSVGTGGVLYLWRRHASTKKPSDHVQSPDNPTAQPHEIMWTAKTYQTIFYLISARNTLPSSNSKFLKEGIRNLSQLCITIFKYILCNFLCRLYYILINKAKEFLKILYMYFNGKWAKLEKLPFDRFWCRRSLKL